MKRLISIISVITLLFTMLSVPVMAANEAAVNSVILGPINASSGTVTDIEAGAAASVSARKFSKAANTADSKIVMSFSETELNSFTGYDSNDRIHASLWYLAPTQGASNVSFMMSDHGLSLTDTLSLTSVPVNKWTKIDLFMQPQWTYVYNDGTTDNTVVLNRIVDIKGTKDAVGDGFWEALLGNEYDSSKTYTLGSVSIGKFEAYIDGELALSKSSRKLGGEGYYSSVATNRLSFGVNKSVDTEFYLQNAKVDVVNDFDVSTFDFGMAEIEDGSDYVASGTALAVRNDVAVSDIAAEGYSVNAYTYDSGTYTPVSADTALSIGNTVVVQKQDSENLEMIYYSVSEGKLYEYSNSDLTITNSTATAGTGIGGKASDDTSGAASSKADVFFDATGVDGSNAKFIYTFEGYKVITVNMYVSDNSKGGTFRISGQYGNTYTDNISVSELVPNQWNKVDFVLKMEARYGDGYTGAEPETLDATLYNGTSSTYVNGNPVATNKNHAFGGWIKAGGSDPIRHGYTFRMGYNTLPEGVSAYIDDYSSYYTYFEPVISAMPAPVEGNIGDSVASVTAQGAKVFKDDTYRVQLTEGTLSQGNVIVKEADSVYVYSIVSDPDIKHYMTSSDTFESTTRFDRNWTPTAIGGKAADDYSLKLTKHAHETDANYKNMYPQFIYNRGADAKAYTVIALNLYVPADATMEDFGIYSQSHTNLGSTLSNSITRDKWHTIVDVIDYTEGAPKATMYLDGEVYGEAGRLIDAKGTAEAPVYFGGSGFNQIRLSFNTGDITDTSTIYMDDIIVYETDEKFVPAKLTEDDVYGDSYDLVQGDRIYVAEGESVTVAQVKEIVADAVVVRAGEVLADDAVIAKGDVVRYGEVENYVKNLSGYKAIVVSGNTFGSDGIRMYKADGTTAVAAGDAVNVRIADGGVLVAAGYDAEGAVINVDTDMQSSGAYKAVTIPDAANVSFIAVKDFNSLKPVCRNLEIAPVAE